MRDETITDRATYRVATIDDTNIMSALGGQVSLTVEAGAARVSDYMTAERARQLGTALCAAALERESAEPVRQPDPVDELVDLPAVTRLEHYAAECAKAGEAGVKLPRKADRWDRALGEGRL